MSSGSGNSHSTLVTGRTRARDISLSAKDFRRLLTLHHKAQAKPDIRDCS